MRCADCKHYEPDADRAGYGHCSRWHHGYGVILSDVAPNEAWVEDDEGWGNLVGQEFGCVLFQTTSTAPRSISDPMLNR